jgi:hypothetical protein
MNFAAVIILGVCVFLTSVLVIALFIWAAVKDGQEDKALQTRLGACRPSRRVMAFRMEVDDTMTRSN